jgi:hypothetical protein
MKWGQSARRSRTSGTTASAVGSSSASATTARRKPWAMDSVESGERPTSSMSELLNLSNASDGEPPALHIHKQENSFNDNHESHAETYPISRQQGMKLGPKSSDSDLEPAMEPTETEATEDCTESGGDEDHFIPVVSQAIKKLQEPTSIPALAPSLSFSKRNDMPELPVPVKEQANEYESSLTVARTVSRDKSWDVNVPEGTVMKQVETVELTAQQLLRRSVAMAAAAEAQRRQAAFALPPMSSSSSSHSHTGTTSSAAAQLSPQRPVRTSSVTVPSTPDSHQTAQSYHSARQHEPKDNDDDDEDDAANEIRKRVQAAKVMAARMQAESEARREAERAAEVAAERAAAEAASLEPQPVASADASNEQPPVAKAADAADASKADLEPLSLTKQVPEFNEEDDEEETLPDDEETIEHAPSVDGHHAAEDDATESLTAANLSPSREQSALSSEWSGTYAVPTTSLAEQQQRDLKNRPPLAPFMMMHSPTPPSKSVSFDQLSAHSDSISQFSADSALATMPGGASYLGTGPSPRKTISEIIRRDLWNSDTAVVEAALYTLAEKAEAHISYRSNMARAGGILAIVRAMEQHSGHGGIQIAACRALEKLALDTENELAIGEVGGVEAVLGAMMAHFTDSKVQEAAWSALWNCTCGNACDTMTIDTQGGMAAIVSCMKQHIDNPVVQVSACGTLSNLCLDNDDRLTALAEADGFSAMAQAMQRHWHNPVVRNEACHAMVVLLERNANQHDDTQQTEDEEIMVEEQVFEEEVL